MAHFYVVRTKSDKTGPIEKKLFYGVPVTKGRITTDQLAEEIADRCSLTRGDVLGAVCEMSDIILERLPEAKGMKRQKTVPRIG